MTDEFRDMEALLRGVVPAGHGMARDEVMFAAGRASAAGGRRRVWPWQAGCGVLAVVVMGVVLMRPEPVVVERRVVEVREVDGGMTGSGTAPVSGAPERMRMLLQRVAGEPAYVEMRDAVLQGGLDALPGAPAVATVTRPEQAPRRELEGSEALPAWQRESL